MRKLYCGIIVVFVQVAKAETAQPLVRYEKLDPVARPAEYEPCEKCDSGSRCLVPDAASEGQFNLLGGSCKQYQLTQTCKDKTGCYLKQIEDLQQGSAVILAAVQGIPKAIYFSPEEMLHVDEFARQVLAIFQF